MEKHDEITLLCVVSLDTAFEDSIQIVTARQLVQGLSFEIKLKEKASRLAGTVIDLSIVEDYLAEIYLNQKLLLMLFEEIFGVPRLCEPQDFFYFWSLFFLLP